MSSRSLTFEVNSPAGKSQKTYNVYANPGRDKNPRPYYEPTNYLTKLLFPFLPLLPFFTHSSPLGRIVVLPCYWNFVPTAERSFALQKVGLARSFCLRSSIPLAQQINPSTLPPLMPLSPSLSLSFHRFAMFSRARLNSAEKYRSWNLREKSERTNRSYPERGVHDPIRN